MYPASAPIAETPSRTTSANASAKTPIGAAHRIHLTSVIAASRMASKTLTTVARVSPLRPATASPNAIVNTMSGSMAPSAAAFTGLFGTSSINQLRESGNPPHAFGGRGCRLRRTGLQRRLGGGIDVEATKDRRRDNRRENGARGQRDQEKHEGSHADFSKRGGIGRGRDACDQAPDHERDHGHPDRVDEQRAQRLDPPRGTHEGVIAAHGNQQAEPQPGHERDQDARCE